MATAVAHLRLPAGTELVETAVNPRTGRFYALDATGTLHILEGDPPIETATRPGLWSKDEGAGEGRSGCYRCLAVNPVTNRLYVEDRFGGQTLILDGEKHQVIGSIPLTGTLAVNQASNKILITVPDTGVYVVDGYDHRRVQPIPGTVRPGHDMYDPHTLWALDNPATGEVYVITTNGGQGSSAGNLVERYDGGSYERAGWLGFCNCQFFREGVLDARTGSLYSTWSNGSQYPTLAIHDAEMRLVEQLMGIGQGELALDADHGRLYLLEGSALVVVETATRDVIAVHPLDEDYDTLDLDPERNRVILADLKTARILAVHPDALSRSLTLKHGGDSAALQGTIVSVALSPAYDEDGTVFVGGSHGFYKSTDRGEHWRQIVSFEDEHYGGPVTIAPSPDYRRDQTLFINWSRAGRSRGVFRSSDGGEHWQSVSAGLRELNVYEFVFSPDYAHDRTMWAVSRGCGWPLASSTDAGYTWHLAGKDEWPTAYPPHTIEIAVSPSPEGRPILYSYGLPSVCDLCRSVDGGRTWAPWGGALPERWPDTLLLSPAFLSDHTVFATEYELRESPADWRLYWSRLYRSTDGGSTWRPLGHTGTCPSGRVPATALEEIRLLALSPNYAHDRTIFAADWQTYRLYKSSDGGECWEDTGVEDACGSSGSLAVSPAYAHDRTLFAVLGCGSHSSGLYRSVDGGRGWQRLGGSGQ